MLYLQFTETPRFIQQALKILGENEIERLQIYLLKNPDKGVVIQNSGGIRKLRDGHRLDTVNVVDRELFTILQSPTVGYCYSIFIRRMRNPI